MLAKERWDRLDGKRRTVLERARDCAKLTIPALLPPEGYQETSPLPTPYQSLGARGVNNLASKLLLSMFPPGQTMFRLKMDENLRKQLGASATQAEEKLAEWEMLATDRIEASGDRAVLFEALAHVIAAGNVLIYRPKSGLRMYRLDQYVVSRRPNGQPREAVVHERVHPSALSDEVRTACKVEPDKKDTPISVYTLIEWDDNKVVDWQEINGIEVPNSRSQTPADRPLWLPLRWRAVPGQDYGRGHVEEYLGDLRSLEGLTKSVVLFAAAASKVIPLVRPGAQTKFEDIAKAESGQPVKGIPEDVAFLQMEKYADFQVAKSVIDELTLRLSHAFLLNSGTVRDAERVTAEEIRQLAQELEDALGGTYTVLSQELQLPYVRTLLFEMQRSGLLPPFPKGTVQPVIVTGFAALGRNHSVNKLRAWLADLQATVPDAMAVLKKDEIAKRLGTGHGVEKLLELIKTPEELADEQEQAVMANVVDKAAGPVLGQAAKNAAQ